MTDAQAALAQVREALSAGPTPGPWSLKTVPTSDGSCHKIGPFPSASRVHSETHACVYAIGIRLGIDDSTPVARELLANARLMAACSPANIAAILAHVDAQAAEIERLRSERDSIAIENSKFMDQIERLRDELRRQLAEAELDAERYRWLRNEANTARKCDPMVCIYPMDEQDLIDGDRLDVAIDAAMGASNEN